MDRVLDIASAVPRFLWMPEVATTMTDAIRDRIGI
jgi:hypothetical protein